MTIAELLVQTTATLGAAAIGQPDPAAVFGPLSSLERAQGEARAIVAAIYGEPCSGFLAASGQSFMRGSDGEACACGWPRSQHEAKP